MTDLTSFDAYCFDLDGTIFVGDTLLPGVQETIAELRSRRKKIMFLTNTSVQTRLDCQKRLERLGLPCELEEIMTAIYVSGMYFRENAPDAAVYLLGEPAMEEELRQFGVRITEEPLAATHVLVGMDRNFSYDKLNLGMKAIRRGAKLVAANPDPVCPATDGVIPDTWSLVKALETAGQSEAYMVIGKPSSYYAQKALQSLGIPSEKCLMVGDRLETDILLGLNSGMRTALVLTGIASADDIGRDTITPDFVIATLGEIYRELWERDRAVSGK
ncbi:HAD-IIA family hydrolase [Paenibacillus contaminans]|uniref:Acid sugar phosphatase n=1 Tax=Paenibacillus contaminans TaxID=450362 RepID=A0A329MGW5_9BACL|nr:HAD-IIA family hydrolase [Paenibacillus contaminans]RAV17903.1 haloacid dehalogenase [Paenibacillus contaminans]